MGKINRFVKYISVFVTIIILSCDFNKSHHINFISDLDYIKLQLEDHILIDVRSEEEFNSGHIENSVNINFYSESFRNDILEFNKKNKIIIYCRTMNRSSNAADILIKNGYYDVSVIRGGITAWMEKGNNLKYHK